MLNLMIVDDEPLVRITLKSVIPWQKYGFYVLEEAENGKQCLEILERQKQETQKIDIVITDIKMPVIDGLELIESIKKKYPSILIIVLSAYEEFSLVKKALMSGAEDYILKSELNEESTKKTLLAVKNKHEAISQKLQYEMDLKKDSAENIEILKFNFFKGLILGDIEPDENQIGKYIQNYHITLNQQDLILIVLVINDQRPNERITENIVKNFINELLKKERDFYALISDHLEVTVLRSYCGSSKQKKFQMMKDEVNKISDSIKKFLNIDVTVAVSETFCTLACVNKIYKKTRELINYNFSLGKDMIFFEQNYKNMISSVNLENINQLSERYRSSIDKLDFVDAKGQLHKITQEFAGHYSKEIHQIMEFYCRLLTAIVDKSIELSLYNEVFLSMNPYEHMLDLKTIFSVEGYLINLLEKLEKRSGLELKTQYGVTIGKVMNYVLQNYHKDINLNKVSEELNFNSSYLSVKFKEIMQSSFTNYLNTVRIDHAKKLMAERKYRINQISEMVGYNDHRYFCRIFKKIVGMTPREYINL